MSGRIMTMQRQARELGRLRTGYSEATSGKRARPVRSDTWIISSHAEHYIESAAEQWGGKVEKWTPQGGGAEQYRVITATNALDAILPSGDPLSQGYELWSGGGAVRRCDGITESLSDQPCLCLAKFGDLFYEQDKGTVCDPTSRLNVFLPDMPDVGVWRAETHSYYAAQEIAGAVDLIRSATGGEGVIPIRLRIEQRQRKAKGQTKRFPVIVTELRGITTGQVLTGTISTASLGSSTQRQAITAGQAAANGATQDVESTLAAIAAITDVGELRALYSDLNKRGVLTDELVAALRERSAALDTTKGADAIPAEATPEQLWSQIVAGAPEGWSTAQLEDDFKASVGVDAGEANADHMRAYLDIAAQGVEDPQ